MKESEMEETNSECVVVVFGSILAYYVMRLLFRMTQPVLDLSRSSVEEVVELWTIVILAYYCCVSLLMTNPSNGSWLTFFIGLVAGSIAGLTQRQSKPNSLQYGISTLWMILLTLMASFYFVILLKSVSDTLPYWISIAMIVLIYIGWTFTRNDSSILSIPWWWILTGLLMIIHSFNPANQEEQYKIGSIILWGIWGTIIGLLAGQGFYFWGNTEKTTIQTQSIIQETTNITELKNQIYHIQWGLQFLLLIPLLLGTWWWLVQN